MMKAYELVRNRLRTIAERRKDVYDLGVRQSRFEPGETVWYFYPRRYLKRSQKWQFFYVGPYTVIERLSNVNYLIRKSPKDRPFVAHVDKLKRHHPRPVCDRDPHAVSDVKPGTVNCVSFVSVSEMDKDGVNASVRVGKSKVAKKKKVCNVCGKEFAKSWRQEPL